MTWPWLTLAVLAVVLVVVAEWPRAQTRLGPDARSARSRAKRKRALTVIPGGSDDARGRPAELDEHDDFARSVQADLDALPTIDEPQLGQTDRPPDT